MSDQQHPTTHIASLSFIGVLAEMQGLNTAKRTDFDGVPGTFVQWFLLVAVIFLCAGELVPSVNESHYLPKAKHAWDVSFASGGDIFLESHDSHMLASASAGIAARLLPLPAVAWLGRLISWGFLAFAWLTLTRNLGLKPWLRPLALAAWFLATKYGHWAGEWAIGGFEAKSIAYPCVIMALAKLISVQKDRSWAWTWIWLGLAVAWHPLVGGWAGLSIGLVWLWLPDLKQRFAPNFPWLILASLIGLVGVVPAASGIGGVDVVDKVAAPQVHVYLRLAHHMCPRTFAVERHWAAVANLLALGVASLIVWRSNPQTAPRTTPRQPSILVAIAWVAVGISLIGLAIDVIGSPTHPYWTSKFLRFYWFRWSDISVPLAWTVVFCVSVQRLAFRPEQATDSGSAQLATGGTAMLTALVLAVLVPLGLHVQADSQNSIPSADRLMVEANPRFEIDSDRYIDWLAACAWIRENTPEDALWLTPKYQQTFKWHAGRAEVVCWKDIPQDNASVLEWYRRINACGLPRDRNGELRDWTTEELLRLAAEYKFHYVLLDRAYQASPPRLEIVYPVETENRSFAICRIPAATLE